MLNVYQTIVWEEINRGESASSAMTPALRSSLSFIELNVVNFLCNYQKTINCY